MVTLRRDQSIRRRHWAGHGAAGAHTGPVRPPATTASSILLAAITGLAVSVGIVGCARSPAPSPPLSPAAPKSPSPAGTTTTTTSGGAPTGAGQPTPTAQQSAIVLPVTLGVSFQHPAISDATERQVLFTVQQAYSALLLAEYSPRTAAETLRRYWSGSALSQARADSESWGAAEQQPVGVLTVSVISYTPIDPAQQPGRAETAVCEDWRDVARGAALTHIVGPPVQARDTPGTFSALGLSPAGPNRWTVSTWNRTATSPRCRETGL